MTDYRDLIIEGLAANAAGDEEQTQLNLDRVVLRLAASVKISCRICGDILDQTRTIIPEVDGQTLHPYCSKHLAELRESLTETIQEPRFSACKTARILTWNGAEVIR